MNKIFIISAPSGTGKTTLTERVSQQVNNLQISISSTTRVQRLGEQDGVNYHFITKAVFQNMINNNEFLEYAEIFGNYYGTSRTLIEQWLANKKDVILEIDWQGARQIRQQAIQMLTMPQVVNIFILPPSIITLKERLYKRGQDSADIIAYRINQAREEIAHCAEYDYFIVNKDLTMAVRDLIEIINSSRLIKSEY